MKLIEVIILTGVHCASPVQHTPQATEAGKVWCAVIVEADSVTKRAEVSPPEEARNPLVVAALKRLDATLATPPAPEPPTVDLDAIAAQVAAVPGSASTPPLDQADDAPSLTELPPAISPDVQPSDSASTDQASTEGEPQPASSQPEIPEPESAAPEAVPEAEPAVEATDQQPETETAAVEKKSPTTKTKAKARAAKPVKKQKASARRRTDVCGKTRQAVWYTNKDGKRKYRCRRPGDGRLY